MKLKYRILEVAKGDKQDCNYCSLSFRDFRFKDNLTFNIATHQVAAFKDYDDDDDDDADIAYICADCKKDLESNILPYCELCGRLQRNRKGCFCNLLKDKPVQSLSTEEIVSRTFGYRLEKKTRELEKELQSNLGKPIPLKTDNSQKRYFFQFPCNLHMINSS